MWKFTTKTVEDKKKQKKRSRIFRSFVSMRSAVDIARQMSRIEVRITDEPENSKLHAQRRIAERQLELRLELEAYRTPR